MRTVIIPLLLPVLSSCFTKTRPVVTANKGDFLKILAFLCVVKARLHFTLGKRRNSEIKAEKREVALSIPYIVCK